MKSGNLKSLVESLNLSVGAAVSHPTRGEGKVLAIGGQNIKIEWNSLIERVVGPEIMTFDDAQYLEKVDEGYSDDPEDAEVDASDSEEPTDEEPMTKKTKDKKRVDEAWVTPINTMYAGSSEPKEASNVIQLTLNDLMVTETDDKDTEVPDAFKKKTKSSDDSDDSDDSGKTSDKPSGSDKSEIGTGFKADVAPDPSKTVAGKVDKMGSNDGKELSTMAGADSAEFITPDDMEFSDVGDEGISDIKVLSISESSTNFGLTNADIGLIFESENADMDSVYEGAEDFAEINDLVDHQLKNIDVFVGQMLQQLQRENNITMKGKDDFTMAKAVAHATLKYVQNYLPGARMSENMGGDMGYDMDSDMTEHMMDGNELALTVDLAEVLFKALRDQAPDDEKVGAIARGLASCCNGNDRALTMDDADKAMDAIKSAYSSEENADDVADGVDVDEPDVEERVDGDGELVGPEGGEEHEGKTQLMDMKGLKESHDPFEALSDADVAGIVRRSGLNNWWKA